MAEAFGGRLGLVNVAGNRLLVVRELEAHNIGDLVLAGDGRHLLVPHQLLDAGEATTRGGVHWGGVLLNVVRSVSLQMLEQNSDDLRSRLGLDYVGIPDRAAGDPTSLNCNHLEQFHQRKPSTSIGQLPDRRVETQFYPMRDEAEIQYH